MIYPQIKLEYSSYAKGGVRFSTTLRKEAKGVWYLWEFSKIYTWTDDMTKVGNMFTFMERFNAEVYKTLKLGVINSKLKGIDGTPVFKKDPDQTPEKIRLKNL